MIVNFLCICTLLGFVILLFDIITRLMNIRNILYDMKKEQEKRCDCVFFIDGGQCKIAEKTPICGKYFGFKCDKQLTYKLLEKFEKNKVLMMDTTKGVKNE